MTTERDNEIQDECVSKTYQDLGDERVPERISQDILQLANDEPVEPKPAASWLSMWSKPVALAATIAVSLAIVLEITQIPDSPVEVTSPPVSSISEAFEPKAPDALDAARQRASDNAGPVIEEPKIGAAPVKRLEAEQQHVENDRSEKASLAPQSIDARNDDDSFGEPARRKAADVPAAATNRAFSNDTAAAVSADASLSMTKEEVELETAHHCDAAVRQIADDWLACIEDLRMSGATDEANRELREFRQEFPLILPGE